MNTSHFPSGAKTAEPMRARKAMRPNSLRNAQVMPPHHVDLTLSPSVQDDLHVPANMAGINLMSPPPAG